MTGIRMWVSAERDANGWRIPRAGTISRSIYDGMVAGVGVATMAQKIRRSRVYVSVVAWRIKNPAVSNLINRGISANRARAVIAEGDSPSDVSEGVNS